MKRITQLLAALFISLTTLAGNPLAQPGRLNVSDDIALIRLSSNAYLHVSVSPIEGFGMVSSNGVVLVENGEAFLFDTPTSSAQTETLVKFVADSLHATIVGFVPNHWHGDCMGGIESLHRRGVKSYASQKTIDLAREHQKPLPQTGFTDSLKLQLGAVEIACYYLGTGHSSDNIVVWIPSGQLLFAGCMVKDIASKGLGNTAESNVNEWKSTIEKLIDRFPSARIVVPGHGETGGRELLCHTLNLLQ